MSKVDNPKVKDELERLIASFNSDGKELSKKQIKKLTRKAQWIVHKPERKAREKEKRKRKKAEEKSQESLVPKKRFKLMKDSKCNLRVAIDLSFADLMTDHDIGKTLKQIQRCYSSNRQTENPVQLYLTSIAGKIKSGLESRSGCMNWDVHYVEADYVKAFKEQPIVYLTSESPNLLETLDDTKVYIIGGLVDHNKEKGLTFRLAEEKGVAHARLPIDNVLDMKTRKVLSIYHVFEILLCVSQGDSWKDSFLKCLPKRKGATVKDVSSESDDDNESQVEHCDINNKNENEDVCCDSADEKVSEVDTGQQTDIPKDLSL